MTLNSVTLLNSLSNISVSEFDSFTEEAFDALLNKRKNEQDEKLLPLITLIVQSLKFGLSDSDLQEQLVLHNFNEQHRDSILSRYKQLLPNLRQVLQIYDQKHVSSRSRYLSLEWRVQIKVASKHLRNQLSPLVILRFQTINSRGKREIFTMECQIEDIYHILDQLEGAIKSMNNSSNNFTKVLRQIR